ncbi:hypothetical protein HCH_06684 [Hahella chejuensis KCTC 2396]|uniref:Uncharacterized protein n=1 Tax=Hahella chejuensis (strain KCTC 2396) TaxID=349521 RepID=Q2S7R0_HAHCH|nr:hypothetical protein HCH_06684 [Hahella chejuensis KCTC 2396]
MASVIVWSSRASFQRRGWNAPFYQYFLRYRLHLLAIADAPLPAARRKFNKNFRFFPCLYKTFSGFHNAESLV